MIRFCPNCETERGLNEILCKGKLGDLDCGWDLAQEPLRPEGWRPTPPAEPSTLARCVNGHEMTSGDFICAVCGSDAAQVETSDPATITVIDGWNVERALPSDSKVEERFLVINEQGEQAVLRLYAAGSEPDPSVYEVLKLLSIDHIPKIHATGRWQDRAYEINEELTGGTLAELGLLPHDSTMFARVVEELGRCLHSFSEHGLRHRDLRPGAILVRQREPLDLVITSFGSARLSEFDLDIVSPLETTRYSAPEAIAGGVAAASDWWSLGMILLEQVTRGKCFEGVNQQAFLIHVITNGPPLPDDLDPRFSKLLRGLLARDRRERWSWNEVERWLAGEDVPLPRSAAASEDTQKSSGPSIELAGKSYYNSKTFALAAADSMSWDEAKDKLLRGAVVTWAEAANVDSRTLGNLRQLRLLEHVPDDFRLSLALKVLNPLMPVICRGDIVGPRWLLDHAEEGYELITGGVPGFLKRLDTEQWLSELKTRATKVRERARLLEIELEEAELRIHLLSTSNSRLEQMWITRRSLFPESDHPPLSAILERRQIAEEDLILLLSAKVGQFRTSQSIIDEAAKLAAEIGFSGFNAEDAANHLLLPRREIYRQLDQRIAKFSRCAITIVDEWVDQFRVEHRISIPKLLIALSVPAEQWTEPARQAYVATLLDFFEKRVSVAVQRGPLSRMTIARTTARIDLTEVGTVRRPASALLEQIVLRGDRKTDLDPAAFAENATLERRLRSLHSHAQLYLRDTGVNGLYLAFPFLLIRTTATALPRIAPVLLWPIRIDTERRAASSISIAFDREREEVRLNPTFNALLGNEKAERWKEAVRDLLEKENLNIFDVLDGLGMLADVQERYLVKLPHKDVQVGSGERRLVCSAVLFHLDYMGQAVVEDLRQLKGVPPAGTALETLLKVTAAPERQELPSVREADKFFTAESDPSQEAAVLEARQAPGLVVDGPPGTGKSQTIVNMVSDAIGSKRNLLVVCQKQAALEVVHKRLTAEGLADRIMMITDEGRDRERTIRLIREQLETLRSTAQVGAQAWRMKRSQIAARIEALEAELDGHHAALHEVDQITGLTYRFILGELIALDAGPNKPIEAPRLRAKLSKVDAEAVATLQETCAPLARQWLPSNFENNPLQVLKEFTPDPSNLNDFDRDFRAFVASEEDRLSVLTQTPGAFSIPDPNSTRDWLTAHSQTFATLSPIQRQRLVEWLPLFSREPTDGSGKLAELESVRSGLEDISVLSPDKQNKAVVTTLSDPDLSTWLALAEEINKPVSFFAKLSPSRWLRKRRLLSFFADSAIGELSNISAFIAAAQYETALRPWRTRLAKVASSLHVVTANLEPQLLAELLATAIRIHSELSQVQELAKRLRLCPLEPAVLDAIDDASSEAFAAFVDRVQQGLRRNEARVRSHEALQQLELWFNDEWIANCRSTIDAEGSNSPALDLILTALPTAESYLRFRRRAANLSPPALETFRILRGIATTLNNLDPMHLDHEVRRTIERESRLAWKERLEEDHPVLLLEAAELESKVSALADANEQMRTANRRLLVDGIDTSRLSSPRQWEEITRLRGQRAQRLREFMSRGADLGLMELRPIWLMNPDVASRILPLKSGLFDAVIYDEASQIPIEFALPTLFRSRLSIVSGDEKQMPPTGFFSSRVGNDESDSFEGDETDPTLTEQERAELSESWDRRDIKDCTNLLELSKVSLPSTTLQIHYRSAYRELISFSNASFYEDRLSVPVRHPDDVVRRVKPLELVRVDGLYMNQTNPDEVAKVIEILATLWDRPVDKRPSVGVVTFNLKQADLIEEALQERAEYDASFSAALSTERERKEGGEDMGFFVKNVENVQGDERDVIIFSSTFGKNAQGTFRRNFGVLGQGGGEKRLNVAITRAREKVYLVTSMPLNEISDLLTTHRPANSPRDYLQGYFEYARAVSAGEMDNARTLLARLHLRRHSRPERHWNSNGHDGFQIAVCEYISSLGWTVADLHDGGPFGADVGIEDPATGLYAIAIDCDSPRHHLLTRARAREMWRPKVLARAIPHIHRVSSHRWYHDPEAERERLKTAIDRALPGRSM